VIVLIPKLFLASSSPRRIELMALLGLQFKAYPPEVNEGEHELGGDDDSLTALATAKAKDVIQLYEIDEGIVIAADTIIVFQDKVIGKPRDRVHAKKILEELSGNTHCVKTGVVLIDAREGTTLDFVEETHVTFYELGPRDIQDYLETKEFVDKAGAYGIQGRGGLLVESIRGDHFTVVGLPIGRLHRTLREMDGSS